MNQVLVGYYHYYGITDNYRSLKRFRDVVIKRLFFWLNKRSQRRSYNWDSFNELIKTCPIAKPKIYVTQTSHIENGKRSLKNQYFSSQNSFQAAL